MTTLSIHRAAPIARPVLVVAGLAGVVVLRWAATRLHLGDPVGIGLLFATGLGAIAWASGWRAGWRPGALPGWRPGRPAAGAVAIGLGGAGLLVAMAALTRSAASHWDPAAAFGPWAIVTVLVATAEEVVLRGVLFDDLADQFGGVAAVLATSAVFALMHVPTYGWSAVPLDLGVGFVFAGLRLVSGGIAAPAIAHAVADLATWWF